MNGVGILLRNSGFSPVCTTNKKMCSGSKPMLSGTQQQMTLAEIVQKAPTPLKMAGRVGVAPM